MVVAQELGKVIVVMSSVNLLEGYTIGIALACDRETDGRHGFL